MPRPSFLGPKPTITKCCNEKCSRDLSTVNPTWGLKGSPDIFCSRLCRYEKTGEISQGPAPAANRFEGDKATAQPIDWSKQKASVVKIRSDAKTNEDKVKAATPRAPRAAAVPLTGKIHILKPDHKFSGIRGQVWAMIKEGMAAADLIAQANAAGLDGKGVLRKLETHFQVLEIKS